MSSVVVLNRWRSAISPANVRFANALAIAAAHDVELMRSTLRSGADMFRLHRAGKLAAEFFIMADVERWLAGFARREAARRRARAAR